MAVTIHIGTAHCLLTCCLLIQGLSKHSAETQFKRCQPVCSPAVPAASCCFEPHAQIASFVFIEEELEVKPRDVIVVIFRIGEVPRQSVLKGKVEIAVGDISTQHIVGVNVLVVIGHDHEPELKFFECIDAYRELIIDVVRRLQSCLQINGDPHRVQLS